MLRPATVAGSIKNRNATGKRPLRSAVAGRKKVSNKRNKE